MSGPNPPGPEPEGAEPGGEPTDDQLSPDSGVMPQAYSAPESEQFTSGPYVAGSAALYEYEDYAPDEAPAPATPRWPWVVGVTAVVAAVALVVAVVLLVLPRLRGDQTAAPATSSSVPPVQDAITPTTRPSPSPTSQVPPPPPSETTTSSPEPPPPSPSPTSEAPPPPPPPPPPTTPPPPSTPAAPRQVTYTVTGTKVLGDIINVTFTDASGRSRLDRNVYIPWSMTVTPISQSEIGSLQATSFFRLSKLNCSITASDGTVLSQRADNTPVTNC